MTLAAAGGAAGGLAAGTGLGTLVKAAYFCAGSSVVYLLQLPLEVRFLPLGVQASETQLSGLLVLVILLFVPQFWEMLSGICFWRRCCHHAAVCITRSFRRQLVVEV